jgi:hypothetical protein
MSRNVSSFVYVAPARFEDILKLGFSGSPCDRVRSFHERYFEYFDLDRGFILKALDEKDARRIERVLADTLCEHRSTAPLVIEINAGGFTEWYRGAYDKVRSTAVSLTTEGGYENIASLAMAMRAHLMNERDLLYERIEAALNTIAIIGNNSESRVLKTRLRAMLDAYAAFDIDINQFIPGDTSLRMDLD